MSKTNIGDKIIYYRQYITPRTSYATGGRATDEIVFDCEDDDYSKGLSELMNEISLILKRSKEFEIVTKCRIFDSSNIINGHVIVSFNPNHLKFLQFLNLIIENKTSLIFFVCSKQMIDEDEIRIKLQSLSQNKCSITMEHFDGYVMYVISKNNSFTASAESTKGNWGHPTVASRQQFKYIWTEKTSIDAKRRTLQRLVNHAIKRDKKEFKLNSESFNQIIQKAIHSNQDDYEIYSILRYVYLGSYLPETTESSRKNDYYPKLRDTDLIPSEPWGSEDGDGRSNFMVKKLKECIPQLYHSRIKTVLDYGCAEGAITANLCKELQIQPSHCFGADVRKIPSDGFTFILLPNETEIAPSIGTILPSIENSSIDLITASMVFHHVRHVKAAIIELRRVIANTGLLVIREHDCRSPGEAVFLDITHGLYSLALSEPIEWPSFMNEYNAWYRSRDQWNQLMTECGFIRLECPGSIIERHYNASATQNLQSIPAHKNIPNVIKAYYAVYTPNPKFNIPKHTVTSSTTLSNSISQFNQNTASSSLSHVSSSNADVDQIHLDMKRQKSNNGEVVINNTNSNNSNITDNKSTSISTSINNIWTVYESSKHRGNFYIIDPLTNQTKWISPGSLTLNNIDVDSNVNSNISIGEFVNPLTQQIALIKRIEYAKK